MNRLKLWKIVTPIMGVAAVGSIAGAVGYYFYKTAPEKWNNKLQEFREVHLGFDGNQMIGYLATGQYEDTLAAGTAAQTKTAYDASKDHLLYGGEMEYHKVVYVKNLNKNSVDEANTVKKYELNFASREASIIKTLAGKQGDQYQIVTKSEGITFRNPEIRKIFFNNIPDISLPEYQTNGKVDVKKLRSAVNKLAKKDYDDEDIKPYSKDTGALFRLDYMSGDVTLGGVDGKVDTPTTSFVKTIEFDSVDKTKAVADPSGIVLNDVQAKVILDNDGNSIYDQKKVYLTTGQFTKMSPKDYGNFAERDIDFSTLGGLMADQAKNQLAIGGMLTNTYLMPRAMADVSPDTQLIDKKIYVKQAGQKDDQAKFLGKLERYNNEFVVSDLNGIYKDTDGKGHYGDMKITSWW